MAAAEPGRDLDDVGPAAGAEPDLRVARPVLDPERGDGSPGRLDHRLRRVRARPAVGERDAEGGRLGEDPVGHGQREELAVARDGVHRQLRAVDQLLDEDAAAAGLGHRRLDGGCELGRLADEREPALALPVGRLDDAGERDRGIADRERPRLNDACGGEPLALARLRRREHGRGAADRMRQAEVLGNPRRDPDGPVGSRRDDPVDLAGLRETLDPGLVLGRDHRALVGEGESGGERVAVDRDHREVAGRRGLEQAELRRARA